MDRLSFILEAIDTQARLMFLVAGEVWEGHVESCIEGNLTAVARVVGTREFEKKDWQLEEVADMAPAEPDAVDVEEDELLAQARLMAERARDYGEMSLAERLLSDRAQREEQHGRG